MIEVRDIIYPDGSKLYFTSDTHFNHSKIIEFCDRPFEGVGKMNRELIRRWNEKVPQDGIVFHLGDFAWGGARIWTELVPKLNGTIHLIMGNHDVKNVRKYYDELFGSVCFQKQIYVEGRPLYLNHYPFLTYGGIYRKEDEQVWQLFGHVHSKNRIDGGQDSDRLKYLLPTQMDVGVDGSKDYAPYSWYEVKAQIEKQVKEANA